ncbi:MAG: hypothetical protein H0T62_14465 [Parachlamydiaceae bacterium]|nr:hypothetical protein [Parachlamydiaceae bacterium]
MVEKSHAQDTLGLELTSTGLKAAELSLKQGQPQIDRLFHFYFDLTNKHINPLNLKVEEKAFLDLSGKTLVVSAIDANETLVRPLEIKLKKEKDIEAVLLFQAEPLLPYPPENAIIDKITLSQTTDATLLTVLAIKKEHLQRHLDQWKILEIEPEIVTSAPSALAAFSKFALPGETAAHFVLHLGEDQTCCIFIKEGKLIASKASHHSLKAIKDTYKKEHNLEDGESLEKEFADIDWKNLDNLGVPQTAKKLKDFCTEIGKVVFSLMKQTKELTLPPLLITGEGAEKGDLSTLLLKDFSENFQLLTPSIATKFPLSEIKIHAITIGEALTGLPNAKDQINFLQGDYVYPHPWKRLIKTLLIYFGLCVLLALAFTIYGQTYIASKENNVRQQYAELLQTMHKSHESVEKELLGAKPTGEGSEGAIGDFSLITPIESLTQDEIAFRINFLEKELQKVPDLYPLTPNIPRVSDFIAWVATNPHILGKDPEHPLIHIESLNYAMVHRPEISKKQERYQVRVELEFTSVNATAAREFHDSLLVPNDFIDPKGEIKWTSNQGRYKATFLLRDRTAYP